MHIYVVIGIRSICDKENYVAPNWLHEMNIYMPSRDRLDSILSFLFYQK